MEQALVCLGMAVSFLKRGEAGWGAGVKGRTRRGNPGGCVGIGQRWAKEPGSQSSELSLLSPAVRRPLPTYLITRDEGCSGSRRSVSSKITPRRVGLVLRHFVVVNDYDEARRRRWRNRLGDFASSRSTVPAVRIQRVHHAPRAITGAGGEGFGGWIGHALGEAAQLNNTTGRYLAGVGRSPLDRP